MARIAKLSIAEKWARLKGSLGDEVLTDSYGDEEVNELISEAGGDPQAIDSRSSKQARELWERWQSAIAEKQMRGTATPESEITTPLPEVGELQQDDHSHQQGEMMFTVGGDRTNWGLIPEISRAVDRYSQREQLVRTILENAGAIERECDYALPCKLHSDIYINVARICESETALADIVSALDEALEDETFETIVSTNWALATIARRLVLRRTRQRPRIRHVTIEGYDPPNVLEEIKPGASVIVLLDVVVTGGQVSRVTEELQKQKARSVKAITIVDADFAGKCITTPLGRLCHIAMDLARPGECRRCGHLQPAEFNPIAGRMTKKKPPRSPSEFLDQDPVAREFWDFVNTAAAFEHHRIIGRRHYVGFVDTARLLQYPATGAPIVKKLCQRITERSGVPDVVLVPKRVRGELFGRCLVRGLKRFLGASGVRIKRARQKAGHFILDGVGDLSGLRVLVADAAAGHGDTLDELTLLSISAGAASVAGAVLLSRFSEGCEKAFDKRLNGGFVRLYSMPVRPVTVRDKRRTNCSVCLRREHLRQAIADLPEGPVQEVAKKLVPARRFWRQIAAVGAHQMALFPQGPLGTCRPSVVSGIALHALHAAMNDGMAPLSLPEIASSEYSGAKRAALVADLPPGALEPPLLEQLREFLKKGSDRAVWMAIVDFMYRSESADWVDCLGEAIENAESGNQWMDNRFWLWMIFVVYRLVRDRPEIGDQIQPALHALAHTYDRHPVHDGLQGMLTTISEANRSVVLASDISP